MPGMPSRMLASGPVTQTREKKNIDLEIDLENTRSGSCGQVNRRVLITFDLEHVIERCSNRPN